MVNISEMFFIEISELVYIFIGFFFDLLVKWKKLVFILNVKSIIINLV